MPSKQSYYLKASEVAERLNVHRSHVYRLIEDGELPSVRISQGTIRVPEGALSAYIEARTHGGPPTPRRADLTSISSDRYELLETANAFEERSGHDPFEFVGLWRQGEIADTGENADRAIEALALRAALIEAGMVPLNA